MQIQTRKTQSGKDSGGGREERQQRMRELGGGGRSVREDLRFRNGTRENESRGAHEGNDSFRN